MRKNRTSEDAWKIKKNAYKRELKKNIGMLRMQELFFLGEGTLKPLFAQFRPPPPLNFQKVLQETIYSSIRYNTKRRMTYK